MIPLKRHGAGILPRKIKRWFAADLDPRRAEKVFDEFDRIRRYEAWQTHCRLHLTRPLPANAGQGPVVDQGFVTLNVMPPAVAAELITEVDRQHDAARLTRDSAKLKGYQLDDPALLQRLLEAVLTSAVDHHCLEFFRSEYMVYWYTPSRTAASEEPASASFRWHCDQGPRTHLKLLVYLNDYREHGGGTSYLDLAASAAVARTGYLFARGERRTD